MPTLVVWGERDQTIPIEHGMATHRAIPGSRFGPRSRARPTSPTWRTPRASPRCSRDFLATTPAAHLGDADWHELVAPRSQRRRRMRAIA